MKILCYVKTELQSVRDIYFAVLYHVLIVILLSRFPHPVTLAGMFEMGTSYLPVNQNWGRYIHQSNTAFQDMQKESKQLLIRLANDACEYIHGDQ